MATMPPDPSDPQLVDRFQAGDDGAFRELYRRWQRPAAAYARRLVGDLDAEEAVTDAFVKVVEGAYRPTGSFRSFLFTVVRRNCLDRLRRRGTQERSAHLLHVVPEAPEPEAMLDRFRDRERVAAAVQRLPEDHRSALLLYYQQGLSSAEVGAALGLTDQQVRSKLSYARRALRRQLEVPR